MTLDAILTLKQGDLLKYSQVADKRGVYINTDDSSGIYKTIEKVKIEHKYMFWNASYKLRGNQIFKFGVEEEKGENQNSLSFTHRVYPKSWGLIYS